MDIADEALARELSTLTPKQRSEVELEMERRKRAHAIAVELGLDSHDVLLILKQLALPPSERLRRGLTLGRVVRRVAL